MRSYQELLYRSAFGNFRQLLYDVTLHPTMTNGPRIYAWGAPTSCMQISHEAIYRSLFIQTRGVLKKELMAQLRTARRMRRPKGHNAKSGQRHILDRVSIRERPAEIEDRAVPGHWEGDLLTGAHGTHIATLVERNTRFTMLVKIPRKDTTTVVAALAKHVSKLPEELRRSLTWDQGKEMHDSNPSLEA